MVQRDPDQKRPSLHGRLSFTFRAEGDREQHYCFRILGHTHAIAFQSRLRAAMTAAGVDRALKFRHLFILRRGDPPSGAKTVETGRKFLEAGGKFVAPTDDDLRCSWRCAAMTARDLARIRRLAAQRRPLFDTPLFKAAGLCPPHFLQRRRGVKAGDQKRPAAKPAFRSTQAAGPQRGRSPSPRRGSGRPRGARNAEARPAQAPSRAAAPLKSAKSRSAAAMRMARSANRGSADLLSRHVAILAGSGSGKTVLLRRIVEEAALLGIPSIVLDTNNDLVRLGDAWPERPPGFSDEDAAKAQPIARGSRS